MINAHGRGEGVRHTLLDFTVLSSTLIHSIVQLV